MDNEKDEKEMMQEAEASTIEKMSEPTVTKVRKRRHDFYIELALFFVLGILIGVAVKNEALKKVTMGFDDYRMKIYAQDYDLDALQAKAIQAAQEKQAAATAANANPQGNPDGQSVPNGTSAPVEN